MYFVFVTTSQELCVCNYIA